MSDGYSLPMARTSLRIIAGLAAAGIALTACSGDDGGGGEQATSDTTAPPARHHELSPAEIEEYQNDLNAVGCWAGSVDGRLGPRTEAALREFQEAEGITVTGLFGGQSQGALTAAAQAGEPVCAGGESEEPRPVDEASVHELEVWQHDLNVVGCYAGAEDGTLGPQTESAIRAFQTQAGFPVDGQLGPQTEEALAESAAEGGQVCHAAAATGGSTADDGGGALAGSGSGGDTTRTCQVNSGGTWRQQQALDYIAQLEASGITGFGITQGQGGVVVVRTDVPRDEARRVAQQLIAAGYSARLFCDA